MSFGALVTVVLIASVVLSVAGWILARRTDEPRWRSLMLVPWLGVWGAAVVAGILLLPHDPVIGLAVVVPSVVVVASMLQMTLTIWHARPQGSDDAVMTALTNLVAGRALAIIGVGLLVTLTGLVVLLAALVTGPR